MDLEIHVHEAAGPPFGGGPAADGLRHFRTTGAVADLLTGYDRLAGMTPQGFLKTYWIGDAQTGDWNWPPDHGFVKGKFVQFNVPVGFRLSRFGDPSGNFLAPANSPFTKRALPPSSLDLSRNPR